MDENICKGCLSFINNKRSCWLEIEKYIKNCPCLECIVKTTCKSGCEKFGNYKLKCFRKVSI